MTIKQLYPTQRPALDLNFARQKRLDSRVTFTRGSTATYVGSDGLIKTAASGEARFDHDPVTGESLGLLVEESRTNIKVVSTTLNPSFNFSGAVSPAPTATIVAPDGISQTVEILAENTSTSTHGGSLTITGAYSNYATSFFVKAAGRTKFKFDPRENGVFTTFDLEAGTVNGVVNPNILERLPNGWFRVKNMTVTNFRAYSRWRLLDENGDESYTGDGTSGIYLWGLQWENNATFSSSYIPTSGSTVTRSADVASMTGTNFSSWYNQSEGSFIIEHRHDGVDTDGYLLEIGGTSGNYASTHTAHFIGSTSASGYQSRSYFYGYGYPSSLFYFTKSTPTKVFYGYKSGDYAAGADRVLSTTSQSSWNLLVLTVDNYLGLGRRRDGTQSFQQLRISRLTYYPTRLSNAQLQALTL